MTRRSDVRPLRRWIPACVTAATLVVGLLHAVPAAASAAPVASTISAGFGHTCVVTAGGAAACWGRNTYGQIGDDSTVEALGPSDVSGLSSGESAIAAGSTHSCALSQGGAVACWGRNGFGELGDGTNTERHTPVGVTGLASGVAAVSVAFQQSCALTTAGRVMCWPYERSKIPVVVRGLAHGIAAVAVGDFHSCVVTTHGGAKCWGQNTDGELGDGQTGGGFPPVKVAGLGHGVAAIAAGAHHTCALTTAGAVTCWGRNADGQLGNGTTTDSDVPVEVTGLSSGVVAIAAGGSHTCALTSAGGLECWGYNGYGQLGDGTTYYRTTPFDVSGLSSRRLVDPATRGPLRRGDRRWLRARRRGPRR